MKFRARLIHAIATSLILLSGCSHIPGSPKSVSPEANEEIKSLILMDLAETRSPARINQLAIKSVAEHSETRVSLTYFVSFDQIYPSGTRMTFSQWIEASFSKSGGRWTWNTRHPISTQVVAAPQGTQLTKSADPASLNRRTD